MPAPKGTIPVKVLIKLRDEYMAKFGWNWPLSDDYLKELWLEVRDATTNVKGSRTVSWPVVHDMALNLMRECDAHKMGELDGT